MCDFSAKLIAWLDGELPADEAAEIGRHLRGCAGCRNELSAYERLSGALVAYCEGALVESAPRAAHGHRKEVALGVGAAAIAAVLALMIAWPRGRSTRISPKPAHVQPEAPAIAVAEEAGVPAAPAAPEEIKPARRVRAAAPLQKQPARLPEVAQPAIRITIPADAMFPPGAIPEGVSFVADVRFPTDGASQQFLVWP